MTPKFIVVDDDHINNIYNRIIIEMVFPETDIRIYTDPETALFYIQSNYANTNTPGTVLFLDINMPTISGWEFLDAFEQFKSRIKDQLRIYMLSSSVDPRDKEKALGNKNVKDYIEKPLTEQNVINISDKL